MASHLTIITGASRGMGLAMAEQLARGGHDLLCIARKPNDTLAAMAQSHGVACEQWACDLAQPLAVAERLVEWLHRRGNERWEEVALINNAALLSEPVPLHAADLTQLSQAMRVDAEAPLLLAAAFLRATVDWPARRKVLNISSGLGRRAMASSASYCAAKAAMDHFTRCVALEEAGRPNGAKVVSLAPGVIDTDMQVQLRSADPGQFPDVGNFIGLKERNALTSPAEAARRVLAYLQRPDFGANPVADVREGG